VSLSVLTEDASRVRYCSNVVLHCLSRNFYKVRVYLHPLAVLLYQCLIVGFLICSFTQKEYTSCFCRKVKVFGASTRRLGWTHGAKARVTTQMEPRSRMRHAGHQPKFTASTRHVTMFHWPIKNSVLMYSVDYFLTVYSIDMIGS
jgi:hypothetical protein